MNANAAEPTGSGLLTRRATAAFGDRSRTICVADAFASAATNSVRCSAYSLAMGTHASLFLSAAEPVSSIDAVPSGARPGCSCAPTAAAAAAIGCALAVVACVTICRSLPPASA